MIGPPAHMMTVEQLEARCRFHASTAEMFDKRREPTEARKFRELAAFYAAELKGRGVVHQVAREP